MWHCIAIVLTCILVRTNADWHYFIYARSLKAIYVFFPAIIIGGLLPVLLPFSLVISGRIKKHKLIETLGWSVGQSAIIGSVISSVYKCFTGRIQPNLHNTVRNISWNFNFGFLRHGMFWGWPSSHTVIAFAMVVTFIKLYPDNKVIKSLSILYALYVGIGVSVSIHWLSEWVAGAIIGSVIGNVVAGDYRHVLMSHEKL
jgi:hypothetical protein